MTKKKTWKMFKNARTSCIYFLSKTIHYSNITSITPGMVNKNALNQIGSKYAIKFLGHHTLS